MESQEIDFWFIISPSFYTDYCLHINLSRSWWTHSGRIAASHWQLWWIWRSETFWVNLSQGYDCIHSCWVCFDLVRTGTFFCLVSLHVFFWSFSMHSHGCLFLLFWLHIHLSQHQGKPSMLVKIAVHLHILCSEVHYLSLSLVLLYYSPDCTFMSFASSSQYLFLLAISW